MLDDKTLAMLGDRYAQNRLTEMLVLAPCFCGRNPNLSTTRLSSSSGVFATLQCDCGIMLTAYGEEENESVCRLIRKWNTRSSILTPEQIKRLEEMQ